jgi:hypothetical protein
LAGGAYKGRKLTECNNVIWGHDLKSMEKECDKILRKTTELEIEKQIVRSMTRL